MISNKQQVIVWLAVKCHAHVVAKLSSHVGIADRFNSGNRQVIIELYAEKIINYSSIGILRFRERANEAIDINTRRYVLGRSARVLAEKMHQENTSYDPIMLTTAVMDEFAGNQAYANFYLLL